MNIKIKKNNNYSKLVNFKINKDEIIHRWFNIKEGYSKELILNLINEFNIQKGYIVDFFNGSGTTCLVAKEKGYKYFGFEINPFLYLLSRVKLADYSERDIKEIKKNKENIFKKYKRIKIIDSVNLSILEKVFKGNLENILKIRTLIFKIDDKKIRDFFIIAMLSVIDDVGFAKKDGNGLKYPKNKIISNFLTTFSKKIDLMLLDIKNFKYKNKKGFGIINCDSRDIPKKYIDKIKKKTSLIVFSPPYANCFDYTEVYKLELWLGGFVKKYEELKNIRNNSLSSHLNKNLDSYKSYSFIKKDLKILQNKKLWSKKIIQMLNGYFYDMERILNYSYNILTTGGYCIIVVGNSAYSGHIIKTDVILSKIATNIGFSSSEINIARKLRASSQQAKLFKGNNALRESVIILKK